MSGVAPGDRTAASGDSLGLYLREISRFRSLSPLEEKNIARKIQRGDRAALRTLVESNLRFVVSMARRYRGSGYPIHELINEGNLGLMEAARRFDPDRDVRFVTYAGWWVRQAILAAIAHFGQAVSLPPRLKCELYRLELRVRDLTQQLGRCPSVAEIAIQSEMPETDIRGLMCVTPGAFSLDAPHSDERGFESGEVPEGVFEQPVDRELMARAFRRELRQLLSALDHRERFIVESRYGLTGRDPRTLRDLGAELHLSIERVRQIEMRALDRLRGSQRAQQLRGYLN